MAADAKDSDGGDSKTEHALAYMYVASVCQYGENVCAK